ncbi:MAG: metal-dependent hydrolase [Campylobacterota bacterium]|nr:metal-dependent hydrolase [Campylobacterota bacterium]
MKIIAADYTYIDGIFEKKYAVAFDQKIIAVGPYTELIMQYPEAELIAQKPYTVLYPGFINTHAHIEFSANKTTLRYGSYIPWLYSVIDDRNHLVEKCTEGIMQRACEEMLQSGVTSLGAVSSFGHDLETCITTPQRVIYFNELIGHNPKTIDSLYNDFLQRFEASSHYADRNVVPAIAIHSPYSVHPIILKKAVTLAKEKQVPISAHFLESRAERTWLKEGDGEFRTFFKSFFDQDKPFTTIDEFLSHFDGYPTHFAHCVQAKEKELKKIAEEGHTVAHCPRSNRLLGCGRLQIERLEALDIHFSVATDGLSSNYTLNIFDELRAALMMHHGLELQTLAKHLIQSITADAAKILKLDCGRIAEGYHADFALIQLPEKPVLEEDIALWTILYTQKVAQLYIEGEQHV